MLDDLRLPVEVLETTIGSLYIALPWGSFGLRPIVVRVTGVRSTCAPVNQWDFTPQEAVEREMAVKMREVAKLIAAAEAQSLVGGVGGVGGDGGSGGWLEGLATRALENIEIQMHDVEVRYEDRASNPERPFTIGAVLKEFSLRATEPCELQSQPAEAPAGSQSRFFKVQLQDLGLYWDSDLTPGSDHQYLLYPTRATLEIESRRYAGECMSPSVFADMMVERLALSFQHAHVEDAACLLRKMGALSQWQLMQRHRPQRTVMEDPRAWWRYAFECVRPRHEERGRNFRRAGWILTKRKSYIETYRQVYLADARGENGPDETQLRQRLRDLDGVLPIETIAAFRSVVLAEAKALHLKASEERRKSQGGWVSWFLGSGIGGGGGGSDGTGGDGSGEGEGEGGGSVLLSDEERAEVQQTLMEQLDFGGSRDDPPSHVRFSMQSTLSEGVVSLSMDGMGIMRVLFDGLQATKVTPTGWTSTNVLGGFQVLDMSDRLSRVPEIVKPNPVEGLAEMVRVGNYMVAKSIEAVVARSAEGLQLSLQMQPFELIYSASCVKALHRFFSSAKTTDLRTAAARQLQRFRDSQARLLLAELSSPSRVRIEGLLLPSKLVLPVDCTQPEGAALVVDLGRAEVSTADAPATGPKHAGERFHAAVEDMTVELYDSLQLYCDSDGGGGEGVSTLVERFPLAATLDVRAPLAEDSVGETLTVLSMPKLEAVLSPAAYRAIKEVSSSLDDLRSGAAAADSEQSIFTIQAPAAEETTKPWLYTGRLEVPLLFVSMLGRRQQPLVRIESRGAELHTRAEVDGSASARFEMDTLVVADQYQRTGDASFDTLLDCRGREEEAPCSRRFVVIDQRTQRNGNSELRITVSTASMQWNPETLAEIALSMTLPAAEAASGSEGSPVVAPREAENRLAAAAGARRKVVVNVREVRVVFNKEHTGVHLASAVMDRLQLTSSSDDATMAVVGQLGNLQLLDESTPGTAYRELVGLQQLGVDESLVKFRYSSPGTGTLPCVAYGETDDARDYELFLGFSPMRFVYVQQQFLELYDYYYQGILALFYLEEEPADDGNARLSQAAGAGAAASATAATAKTPPRHLIITEMQNPCICLPVSQFSEEHISLDLGHLVVDNVYREENFNIGRAMANVYRIKARDMRLQASTGLEATQKAATLDLSVYWCVDPELWPRVHPAYHIPGTFSDLCLGFTAQEYVIVRKMLADNISGLPTTSLFPSMHRETETYVAWKDRPRIEYLYNTGDPTTFEVTLETPLLTIEYVKEDGLLVANLAGRSVTWAQHRRAVDSDTFMTVFSREIDLDGNGAESRHTNADEMVPLLRSAAGENEGDELKVETVYKADSCAYDITVSKCAVFLTPSCWAILKAHFVDVEVPSSIPVPVLSSVALPSHEEYGWRLDVSLRQPHLIFLPRDLCEAKCFVLKADALLRVNDKTFAVEISNGQLCKALAASPFEMEDSVLERTTCFYRADYFPDGHTTSVLRIGDLDLQLMYTDFLVLDGVLSFILGRGDPATASADALPVELAEPDKSTVPELLRDAEVKELLDAHVEAASGMSSFALEWTALNLTIGDDSGERFQGGQPLATIQVERVCLESSTNGETTRRAVQVHKVSVIDLLQQRGRDFTQLAALNPAGDVACLQLVAKASTAGDQPLRRLELVMQVLELNWNPNTILAVEEIMLRLLINSTMTEAQATATEMDAGLSAATFQLAGVTATLNKEEENRRLLRLAVTGIHVDTLRNLGRSSLYAAVAAVSADDLCVEDKSQFKGIIESRHEGDHLLTFTQTRSVAEEDVRLELGMLRFVHYQQLTFELADYVAHTGVLADALKSGLQSADHLIRSRVPKGSSESTIKEARVKISVANPELVLPWNADCDECIIVRPGDIELASNEVDSGRTVTALARDMRVLAHRGSSDADLLEAPVQLDVALTLSNADEPSEAVATATALRLVLDRTQALLLRRVLQHNITAQARHGHQDVVTRSLALHRRQVMLDTLESKPALTEAATAVRFSFDNDGKRADSAKPVPALNASFALPMLVVTLRSQAEELMRLSLQRVEAAFTADGGGVSQLDVSLHDFTLEDVRESVERPYRRLCGHAPGEAKGPQVMYTLQQSQRSDAESTLVVSDLTVMFLLEALQPLYSFGTLREDEIAEIHVPSGSQELPSDLDAATWEAADAFLSTQVWNPLQSDSRTKFILHNLTFVALEQPLELGSRALLLEGLIHMQLSQHFSTNSPIAVAHRLPTCKTAYELQVDNLRLKMVPDAGDLGGGVLLLAPAHITATHTDVRVPGEVPRTVSSLKVAPISVEMSFLDLKLISALVKNTTEDLVASAAAADRSAQLSRARTSSDVRDGQFAVTFYEPKLGITLAKHGAKVILDEFDVSTVQRSARLRPREDMPLRVGDKLVLINEDPVRRVSYETVIDLIKSLDRPITLAFRRGSGERKTPASRKRGRVETVLRLERPSLLLDRALGSVEGQRGLGVTSAELLNSFLRPNPPLRTGSRLVFANDANLHLVPVEEAAKTLAASSYPLILRFQDDVMCDWYQQLTVRLGGCAFTLIDDCGGRDMPLFRTRLTHLAVHVDVASGSDPQVATAPRDTDDSAPLLSANGELGLQADYYNSRVGLWEPFLEDCHLLLDAEAFVNAAVSFKDWGWVLRLRCIDALSLTISDAAVLYLAETHRRWTAVDHLRASSSGLAPRSFTTFSPVLFRNLTGSDVEVYYSASDGAQPLVADGSRPILSLPSESVSAPLPLSPQVYGAAAGRSETKLPLLSVRIGPGMGTVKGLALGAQGRFLHTLHRAKEREGRRGIPVLWDVEVRDGRRIATLRGALRVRNSLPMWVKIQLQYDARDPIICGPVAPGGMWSLPILEEDLRNVAVCLCDATLDGAATSGEDEEWSWPLFNERPRAEMHISTDSLRTFVAIDGCGVGGKPIFLFLDSDGSAVQDVVITLSASVRLRNALLFPCVVRLHSSATNSLLVERELLPGELWQVCEANAALDQLLLQVHIGGMGASEFHALFQGDGDASETVLEVRDDQGAPFAFHCESHRRLREGDLTSSIDACLFAEHWLRNASGAALAHSAPRTPEDVLRWINAPAAPPAHRLSALQRGVVEEEIFEVRAFVPTSQPFPGAHAVPGEEPWYQWFVLSDGSLGAPPTEMPLPSGQWRWLDPEWIVDVDGLAQSSGWSSRRLVVLGHQRKTIGTEEAMPLFSFSHGAARSFDASHGLRRRRFFRRRILSGGERPPRAAMPDCTMLSLPVAPPPRRRGNPHLDIELEVPWPIAHDMDAEPRQLLSLGTGGPSSAVIDVSMNGAEGAVDVPSDARVMPIAFDVAPLPEPWHRTLLVTLRNRIVLINRTPIPIFVRHAPGTADAKRSRRSRRQDDGAAVAVGEAAPLHFRREDGPRRFQLRFADSRWSAPLEVSEPWSFPLRILLREDAAEVPPQGHAHVLPWRIVAVTIADNVGGSPEHGAVSITVEQQGGKDGGWETDDGADPIFRLENTSGRGVWYAQAGAQMQHFMEPRSSAVFGWDVPFKDTSGGGQERATFRDADDPFADGDPAAAGEQHLQLRLGLLSLSQGGDGAGERTISVQQVGERVRLRGRSFTLSAEVVVEGASRIVRMSERAAALEEELTKDGGELRVALSIPALQVSLVDRVPREVLFLQLSELQLAAVATPSDCKVSARVTSIQADNHLPGASFPVAVSTADAQRRAHNTHNSTRHAAAPAAAGDAAGAARRGQRWALRVATLFLRHPGIYYVKHFSVSLDEHEVRVDDRLVQAAQHFKARLAEMFAASPPEDAADSAASWAPPGASGAGNRTGADGAGSGGGASEGDLGSVPWYFELLQIDRMRLRLSTKRAATALGMRRKTSRIVMDMLTRIEDAHIRLDPYVVNHPFGTIEALLAPLRAHYATEARTNLMEVLGSLHFLGNPAGLVRSLRRGAKDFVAEPMQGLLTSIEKAKPSAIVQGLGRGTGSLLKNSVGGVANSASLITEMVSNHVSTLTMDRRERARQQHRREETARRPGSMLSGLGSGGRSMARGVIDGLAGVVQKPVEGVKRGGAVGLVKGIGAGVVGLVAKPVVGLSDAATDVLRGVKGSVDSLHGPKPKEQVRPRRAIYGMSAHLRPYNRSDAEAARLLRSLWTPKMRSDADRGDTLREAYAGFADTGSGILLLTANTLVVVNMDGRLKKRIPFGDIVLCELHESGQDVCSIYVHTEFGEMHPVRCANRSKAQWALRMMQDALGDFRAAQHDVHLTVSTAS